MENTPTDVKYKYKSKFEPKLLVWIAISPKGMTKPVFFKSGLAVNQYVYRDECLSKFLIPFINKFYRAYRYVFWPDLASSHYSKLVQQYLNENNIQYVPKLTYQTNVSKARPIEDFWAILKQKVYKDDWKAKNVNELSLCLYISVHGQRALPCRIGS